MVREPVSNRRPDEPSIDTLTAVGDVEHRPQEEGELSEAVPEARERKNGGQSRAQEMSEPDTRKRFGSIQAAFGNYPLAGTQAE